MFMLKTILIIIAILYALTFVIFTTIILAKTIRYIMEKKRSTQQEQTLSGTYTLDNSNNTFSVQTSDEVSCEECVWQREEIFSKQKVCPVNSDLGLDGQSCNKGIRK